MSLSAALEEFYASGGEDEFALFAVEITHVAWPQPIRWVRGLEGYDGAEDEIVTLPLGDGGAKVGFAKCAFRIVQPGADRDGPTDGKLQLDGVSGLLHEPLKAAQGYGEPIRVTFYTYLIQDASDIPGLTEPDQILPGLELASVSVPADMAEGTLTYPDGRQLNIPTGPNAFFDRDNYPALFST